MGICTHSVNKSYNWTCRKGVFIVMQMILKDLQRKGMLRGSGCNMRFETPAVDHAMVPQIVSMGQTVQMGLTQVPCTLLGQHWPGHAWICRENTKCQAVKAEFSLETWRELAFEDSFDG